MPNRRRVLLSALCLCCTTGHGQTIGFELQARQDCPIALVTFTSSAFRTQSDRRQFFTVKNDSEKAAAAVVFQQAFSIGSKNEIVALERVSIIIRPHEKKRLSISVRDIWDRIQTAAKASEAHSRPVLSVAVVEFIDGSAWNAPLDRTHP
jgi:hypothetical protein